MKIQCTCGNLIIDQTDYLHNKAYLISDRQWFDFWESIDKAIEESGDSPQEKEEACMQLRKQNVFKTLWECPNCGKLFVDGGDGNLVLYSPDNGHYNRVLEEKK